MCYLAILIHLVSKILVMTYSASSKKAKNILKTILNSWILFQLLIQPSHNTILVSSWLLLDYCFSSPFFQTILGEYQVYFFYLTAQFSHFAMGNSNNLNTIQVYSGMVGVNELNETLVGVLMTSSTFSAIIFWNLYLAKLFE